jgi:hypothetical protein
LNVAVGTLPREEWKAEAEAMLRASEQEIVRRQYMQQYDGVEWAEWLIGLFPHIFTIGGELVGFADPHRAFWEHIYSIDHRRADPFLAIWARDFGKSTNLELAFVNLGCRKLRKYFLYVCGSQKQADDHVGNISALLESPAIARKYPDMGERLLTKHGMSRGWRISRLRTRAGITYDAIGLDKAIRGAKLDEQRPDCIGFDDIDEHEDTERTTLKKEESLTKKILPAGADNLAVIGGQNLIHANSVFSRLVDGRANFLSNRVVSGPFPAIRDLKTAEEGGRDVITGGTALWSGLSIEHCQELVNDIGLNAFLVEHQHETRLSEGLFLGGVWRDSTHYIPPFEIPKNWYIDRGFDWGKSKPWACVWFAEADGETGPTVAGKTVVFLKGTVFCIAEVYGWNGKPNVGRDMTPREIRNAIQAREKELKPLLGKAIRPGPADIPEPTSRDEEKIEEKMQPIKWSRVMKGAGSRKVAAASVRDHFKAATRAPMEEPGLFVFQPREGTPWGCPQVHRTFPILPRDPLDPDDVDTTSEDHLYDVIKGRMLSKRRGITVDKARG